MHRLVAVQLSKLTESKQVSYEASLYISTSHFQNPQRGTEQFRDIHTGVGMGKKHQAGTLKRTVVLQRGNSIS